MPPQRSKRFKLEELGQRRLAGVYAGYAGLFLLSLLVVGIYTERQSMLREEDVEVVTMGPEKVKKFLQGESKLDISLDKVSPWNQDVMLTMLFVRKRTAQHFSYQADPLRMVLTWRAGNGVNRHGHGEIERKLNCPLVTEGECDAVDSELQGCGACDPITLVHESYVEETYYHAEVMMKKPKKGHALQDAMVSDISKIILRWQVPTDEFTNFEFAFRYILVFISLAVMALFWTSLRQRAPFSEWALEQKWTFIQLFSTCLFNNPLYFLNFYGNHWLWPFLNTLFMNSHLAIFLLCVLLYTDNLYKRPVRQSDTAFYRPKLILVGSMWFVGVISFALTRSQQSGNIAQNDVENVQVNGFPVFRGLLGSLTGLYGLWLGYLVVRVMDQVSNDVTAYVPPRTRFVWFTTLAMLLAIIPGLFALVLRRNEEMLAVEFFAFFALYNMYSFLLATLYWPSEHYRYTAAPQAAPSSPTSPSPAREAVCEILRTDGDV